MERNSDRNKKKRDHPSSKRNSVGGRFKKKRKNRSRKFHGMSRRGKRIEKKKKRRELGETSSKKFNVKKQKKKKESENQFLLSAFFQKRKRLRVLIVGDGDFSFSVSLLKYNIKKFVATSYDTKEQVEEKYTHGAQNITTLLAGEFV